ncbi:MAG: hypothetical protein AAGA48_27910 [Myxococcota bacterium]
MALLSWLFVFLFASAQAHPNRGQTSVIVVMKMARCPVCMTQLQTLGGAKLGAPVVGVTHDPVPAAVAVTHTTGVRTYSHPNGIKALGLWRADLGLAQPAVVVFDRCGGETGRIVGREPGVDVTEKVRALVKQADAVTSCDGPPVS